METNWVEYKIVNNILFAIYKKNLIISLEDAKLMVSERLKFQEGKDYPIIIYFNGLKTTCKAARKYMATEGIKGIKMGGFIVTSVVEETIFNFFLLFDKPPIPTRAFTREDDAIKWIQGYKLNKEQLQ